MRAVREIEKAFWTPILMDIAVRGGTLSLDRDGRSPSEELRWLQANVFSFFEFTPEQISAKRHPSDRQPILYNDHQWAIKQLKMDGLITGEAQVDYTITEKGLGYLRREVYHFLSGEISADHLERLIASRDG